MNEVKDTLKVIEDNYKLFLQQQFTFVGALQHTRENAHDMIRPVASISQVQSYMDHHCNNLTDRRILTMFLNICNDLSNLCHKLEAVHPGNSTTNEILERCKLLLNHSNDLSTIRAKYVLPSAEFCGGNRGYRKTVARTHVPTSPPCWFLL
uniref:Sperm acrosome associated 9 n=1 Tax=Pavo cristatus TaxID=9049 RepID=A0A8C9G025_PAVCR